VSAVIASLVPVFLLILAGTFLRRFVIRVERPWTVAEQLVYYVLFPALLIETLARADLSRVPAAGVGGVLALAVLTMLAICLALRGLLARTLLVEGPSFTSLVQGATRWNTTLALAVVTELYGVEGLAIATVAAVAMIPLVNATNVWVLAHYADPQRTSWGRVALAIARNPFIWSCIIGYALNVTHPPVPDAIYDVARTISRATLPLGLLLVGAGLRIADLIQLRRITIVATALKLVLMPVLAAALSAAFGLTGTTLAVVACCAAVPSASNSYVLARQMGGDAPLMAEILTMQTVVAIVTMPIAIALASR
jgi:predicted permease